MSLTIQKGFWQDSILANTKQKLEDLYHQNPNIADSEKRVILEYWKAYDGLCDVLGEKLSQFTSWFFKSTPNETITRCLRSLKEDGTIQLSPEKAQRRIQKEAIHRVYWRNNGKH